MFERNRVDNLAIATVAVEITLEDGAVLTGRAALGSSRAPHKLLEGPEAFLYVESIAGEGTFVPKAAIRRLSLVTPPRVQSLHLNVENASSFDPYKALGVARGAGSDEVKAQYHRLTKLYHPDLFNAVTLPAEVTTYLDGRMKQINAAFRLLSAPRPAGQSKSG